MYQQEVMVPISQTVVRCPAVDQHLNYLVLNWESKEMSATTGEDKQWWQFWKLDGSQKENAAVIARYLLESLDEFVQLVRANLGDPSTYKATIIDALAKLYDSVVTYPWWAKPFSSFIRSFALETLSSVAIDFLNGKYTKGAAEATKNAS